MDATPERGDEFGRAYVRLALAANRHIDGLVDAYIGPPELRAEVEAGEPASLPALLDEARCLEDELPSLEPARQAALAANLRALNCLLRKAAGEEFDYLDEVRLVFDLEPELTDEAGFLEAHRVLEDLVPGDGAIGDRIAARRKRMEAPADRLPELIDLARRETRRRTLSLFELPAGEDVEVELVTGQVWGGYNWFLGDGRSLIQVNTDMPSNVLGLTELFAHEGYPGHHTEGTLKEQELYRGRGWLEYSVFLLLSPAAVIAEGIATTAAEIIFPGMDLHRWNAETMLPAAGIAPESPEEMAAIHSASRALQHVVDNGALLYHTGRLDEQGVIDYLRTYNLVDEKRARRSFGFFTHRLNRAYVFTYTSGHDLIERASRHGDKRPLFRRLLHETLTPSQLAELAA
jgi:hypothetical protein